MGTERFMYFCIQKYIGTQGKFCGLLKILLHSPVVYATDLSKAVVWVFFLFCVDLWFVLRGASCFKVFPCSLSSGFVILFSIVITSLGEGGAGLCASRAFVCLACRCKFLFFFPSSWCRGLAALPELFYKLFVPHTPEPSLVAYVISTIIS